MNKKTIILFSVYFFVYLIWHLIYLTKYPLPNTDDAWLTEPVWRLFNGKGYSSEMFSGVLNLEKTDVYHGRIYSIFHIPLLIFGLGLYQARLSALLASFLILCFTYLIAKRLFNSIEVGVFSAFFLSLSFIFINLSHRVRQETALVCVFLLTFYFFIIIPYQKSNSMKKFLFFICGLLSSLSIDIHLNGIVIVIVGYVIILFCNLDIMKKYNKLFWYSFGVFLGCMWWLFSHVLLDTDSFFLQFYNIILSLEFKPGITKINSIFYLFKRLTYDYLYTYWNLLGGHRGIIEFLIYIFVFTYFIIYKSEANKTNIQYLIVVIIATYLLIPLVSRVTIDYVFLFYPFISILAGMLFSKLNENNKSLARASLIMYFLYSCASNILPISFRYAGVDYNKYIKQVQSFLPMKTKIFSDIPIWFLYPNDYYHPTAYYIYRNTKNKNFKSFLKERGISYLVLAEEDFKSVINKNILYKRDFEELKIELVGEVKDRFFGGKFSYCPLHKYHTTQILKVIE